MSDQDINKRRTDEEDEEFARMHPVRPNEIPNTGEIGRVRNENDEEKPHEEEIGVTNNEAPGEEIPHTGEIGRVRNERDDEEPHEEEIGVVNNERPDEVAHKREVGRENPDPDQ